MEVDLFGPDYFADPHASLAKRRAASPVWWSPTLHRWIVASHAAALAVLRDPRRFSSNVVPQIPPRERTCDLDDFQRLSAGWLFFLDPPRHTAERTLVARRFRAVQSLAPSISAEAERLLASAGTEFDLVADYAAPLATSVIAGLLCATPAERDRFAGWARDIESVALNPRDPATRRRGFHGVSNVTAYVAGLSDAPDFPKRLLADARAAGVSEEAARAHCLSMVFAGIETTQNLIANTVREVLLHRCPVAGRSAAIVEEGLRHAAPVLGVIRRAVEDVELEGKQLCRGDEVVVMTGAANRDPACFHAPDTFLPGRTERSHVGFGHGIHFCVGAPLARLEARIAVETLFRLRPKLTLADGRFEWRDHDPIVHGLKRLAVRDTP